MSFYSINQLMAGSWQVKIRSKIMDIDTRISRDFVPAYPPATTGQLQAASMVINSVERQLSYSSLASKLFEPSIPSNDS
jgi:hypothetical protein